MSEEKRTGYTLKDFDRTIQQMIGGGDTDITETENPTDNDDVKEEERADQEDEE